MKMKLDWEMFCDSSCVNTAPMASAPSTERSGIEERPNGMLKGIRYGRYMAGTTYRSRITDRCAVQKAKVAASEYTAAIWSMRLGRMSSAAAAPKTRMDRYGVLKRGWSAEKRLGKTWLEASE